MNERTYTAAQVARLFACLAIVAALVGIIGGMSYTWSFEETTFGGWLGFLSPPAAIVAAFFLGRFSRGQE